MQCSSSFPKSMTWVHNVGLPYLSSSGTKLPVSVLINGSFINAWHRVWDVWPVGFHVLWLKNRSCAESNLKPWIPDPIWLGKLRLPRKTRKARKTSHGSGIGWHAMRNLMSYSTLGWKAHGQPEMTEKMLLPHKLICILERHKWMNTMNGVF